jgi:choline-glycine betaine transporter
MLAVTRISSLRSLPLGLRLVAVFLITDGVYELIRIVRSGPGSGIDAPASYVAGAITGQLVRAALCVTAGVGILYRRPFGRILGLILLVVAIPRAISGFAYGFAHGIKQAGPTPMVWAFSALVNIAVYGTLFYLQVRKSSRDALKSTYG